MKKGEIYALFKTYFTFSKSERNGIIFLLIIFVAVIAAIKFVHQTPSTTNSVDNLILQKQIDSLFTKNDSLENGFNRTSFQNKMKVEKKLNIEINTADSTTLVKLPGIGPVIASRIVKYRNLLGGFHNVIQLKEVYGMKEEYWQKAKEHIFIGAGTFTRFDLDTAGYKLLYRHPYIGKEKAWKIIKLKKKKEQNYLHIQEIKEAQIFDSAELVKLEPYVVSRKNPVTNENK